MDYKKKYLRAEIDKYTVLIENNINISENLKMLKQFLIEFCKLEYIKKDESNHLLTDRETKIYKLILLGKSNREISSDCFISQNTVKKHVSNILFKLKCKSRNELITKKMNELD